MPLEGNETIWLTREHWYHRRCHAACIRCIITDIYVYMLAQYIGKLTYLYNGSNDTEKSMIFGPASSDWHSISSPVLLSLLWL